MRRRGGNQKEEETQEEVVAAAERATPRGVNAGHSAKHTKHTKQTDRWVRWWFVGWFGLFLWVAVWFEPAVVYYCGWEGLAPERCGEGYGMDGWGDAPGVEGVGVGRGEVGTEGDGQGGTEGERCEGVVADLWRWYGERFDPVFLCLPRWMRILCALDSFYNAPFYALCVYAFSVGDDRRPWFRVLGSAGAGALFYSTVFYFAYEVLLESHRNHLVWVFIINGRWCV
jgi:EXPERA (EXPanded EBP superfamily)